MADIYSVKNINTNKIVETGFDKKEDAKAKRNELCKDSHEKWEKKVETEKDLVKPFPYIVTKGKELPRVL